MTIVIIMCLFLITEEEKFTFSKVYCPLGFLSCEWPDDIFAQFVILFVNILQMGKISLNSVFCFSCKTRSGSGHQHFHKATVDENP